MNEMNREETEQLLRELYKRGFRYITRDPELPYINCWSVKPKKYRDDNQWGYANPDDPAVLPCYVIKNTDITEISPDHRSAKLISDFINIDG